MAKRRESKTDIQSLECSRKTVKNAINRYKQQGFEEGVTKGSKPCKSKMDAYKDKVIEYLEKGLSGIRIHEELLAAGSSLSYSTVSHYVNNIKSKIKSAYVFILARVRKHRWILVM